jgi:hypothetical protein
MRSRYQYLVLRDVRTVLFMPVGTEFFWGFNCGLFEPGYNPKGGPHCMASLLA